MWVRDALEGSVADLLWEQEAEATSEVILETLKNVLRMQIVPRGIVRCCRPIIGIQVRPFKQSIPISVVCYH